MQAREKCFICGERPAAVGILCHVCHDRVESERRKAKTSRVKRPDQFITYQGQSVEMYSQGNGTGIYCYCGLNPEKIPKTRLINLNVYCPTLDRVEVKRLKRIVFEVNRRFAGELQYVKGDN
jgi:hypothetical protein